MLGSSAFRSPVLVRARSPRVPLARRCGGWLAAAAIAVALAGCGKPKGPPVHPVHEISARATARLELVELVVKDRERAARVREIYERVWEIGLEFDQARARALSELELVGADPGRVRAQVLEVPAAGSELMAEYVALMLEVRSLVTEREFARLNAIR